MTGVESTLTLLEGKLDRGDDTDIFIHGDTDSQYILLGLALVELLNADLKEGEVVEGG